MNCSMPDFLVHHQLPELTQTHDWVGDAIQPSHSLSSPYPPTFIFPSIRVFSSESVLCIRWPKYWCFSISPSSEYSGLISFRMDWLDLLIVQGTFKSLLQHHSSKPSVLWDSAFFMVQLSHSYMITGKTIALSRWTSWEEGDLFDSLALNQFWLVHQLLIWNKPVFRLYDFWCKASSPEVPRGCPNDSWLRRWLSYSGVEEE